MIVVGITGGIGTGKSTVSNIFKRLGAIVIDADEIAHRLIEPERPAWKKIVSYFGRDILGRGLYIDRRALGKKAFSDRRRLSKLCGIIHPLVYREIRGRIKRIGKADPSAIVILDVPMLLESCGEKYIDKLIVVSAPRKEQLKRECGRSGLGRADVLRRIRAQMPLKEKIKSADFVVDNGGSLISTAKQTRAIWKRLVAI